MTAAPRDSKDEGISGIERAGRNSPLVREIRDLARDAAERKSRRRAIAEGIHLAQEALRDPARIVGALVSPRLLRTPEGRSVAQTLARSGLAAGAVGDDLLASVSRVESHQGVLLLLARPEWSEQDLVVNARPPRLLVACSIQDPGNLGALARVAEAGFATGLLCAGGADPFSPRSLRASAGALLRIPMIELDSADAALEVCRRNRLKIVGASPRALTAYRDADLGGAIALFVGGEGAGLSADLSQRMDLSVRIPMAPGVESLNVVSAAAVILFEVATRA